MHYEDLSLDEGNIRQLRSDNGTNFVGAEVELKEALKEMDAEKICHFLLIPITLNAALLIMKSKNS